jgi:hypothetical protein
MSKTTVLLMIQPPSQLPCSVTTKSKLERLNSSHSVQVIDSSFSQ